MSLSDNNYRTVVIICQSLGCIMDVGTKVIHMVLENYTILHLITKGILIREFPISKGD